MAQPRTKPITPSAKLQALFASARRQLPRKPSAFHSLTYGADHDGRTLNDSKWLLQQASNPKLPPLARGHLIGATKAARALVKDYERLFMSGSDVEKEWVIRRSSQLPDPTGAQTLVRLLPHYRSERPPSAVSLFGRLDRMATRLTQIFACELDVKLAPLFANLVAELPHYGAELPPSASETMSRLFVQHYWASREQLAKHPTDGEYFWFDKPNYSRLAEDATASILALARVPPHVEVDDTLHDAERSLNPYLCAAAVIALITRGHRPKPASLRRVLGFPHTRYQLSYELGAEQAQKWIPKTQRTPLRDAEGRLAAWCALDAPPAPYAFDKIAERILPNVDGKAATHQYVMRYSQNDGQPRLAWASNNGAGVTGGIGSDSEATRRECLQELSSPDFIG